MRRRRSRIQHKNARSLENRVFSITALFAVALSILGAVRVLEGPVGVPHHVALVTVASGDSLWGLAQRYGSPGDSTAATMAEIRSLNPSLSQGQPLHIGQRLLIPTGAGESSTTDLADLPGR